MTLLALISYALVGIVAGLLGGLLGIGGGLVTVPALLFIFQQMNFPPDHLMQLAVGTSLGAMVFTSASSAWSHHLMKGVKLGFFPRSLARDRFRGHFGRHSRGSAFKQSIASCFWHMRVFDRTLFFASR